MRHVPAPSVTPAPVRRRLFSGPLWGDPQRRLLGLNGLVDATGTGAYTGSVALFLTTFVRLRASQIGIGLTIAGAAAFAVTVPCGLLADRIGPRRFLVWSRAAAGASVALYPFVGSFPAFTAVAVLVAVSAAGFNAANQSLVGLIVGSEQRVATMAALRSIRNAGFAIGGLVAATAIAVDTRAAYDAVFAIDSASFLAGTYFFARIREPSTAFGVRQGPRLRALRDLTYLGLTAASVVYTASLVLLEVGIPLWIVHRTVAPHVMTAIVAVVNTVLVVVLQVRVSRGAEAIAGARVAVARATAWFVAGCLVLTVTTHAGAPLAVTLLVVAAVFLTMGEMLESAGWWTISYDLAPAQRRAEYLAAFALGTAVMRIVGPLAFAALVETGVGGWFVFAALFVGSGLLMWVLTARYVTSGALTAPAAPSPAGAPARYRRSRR